MLNRRDLLAVVAAAPIARAAGKAPPLDVSPVWSGHRVGFAFLTHKGRQYAAFYDAERRMTVAMRKLPSREWTFQRLPSQVVWDSHNYIVMAFDDDDYLHLSGNMHVVPLIYFRTTRPYDITTFEKVPSMVGTNETRCTYPHFLRGPRNEFLFTYRDGRSGSGDQIYNVYDHKTRAWKRLLDKPLTDGQGRMNAYFHGPVKGPDGYFHLCWVWRNHPGCESNHDLSYARSRDMVHWETGAGKAVALPMRVETAEIVDPVPPGGGMLNGNTLLGFDSRKRPVITYHKFDEKGFTQTYNARLEDGRWVVYKTSNWDYRWEFSGGGSIISEIRYSRVEPEGKGLLRLEYWHAKYGGGAWLLDEATFKPVKEVPRRRTIPQALEKVQSTFPGMQTRLLTSSEGKRTYVLRWETLGPNRDRPRTGPLPEPSMLRVYEL